MADAACPDVANQGPTWLALGDCGSLRGETAQTGSFVFVDRSRRDPATMKKRKEESFFSKRISGEIRTLKSVALAQTVTRGASFGIMF